MNIKNYIYDFLKASQDAAIACYDVIGCQDKILADQRAVDAIRKQFNKIDANINIISGEGILDSAPTIDLGEQLGTGSFGLDVALDPIDGTTMTANNQADAMSVIAVAPKGSLLSVPDMYMEKLVAKKVLKDKISLENSLEENIAIAAKEQNKDVSEVVVACLNKPRQQDIIARIKAAGAKVRLVNDGDVSLTIICGFGQKIDFVYLVGGAPEGITSAIVIKCFDGMMQARLKLKSQIKGHSPENDAWSVKEQEHLTKLGLEADKIYDTNDLVSADDIFFVATNITDGSINHGVELNKGNFESNSIILTHFDNVATSLKINALHDLNKGVNHYVK